jgi:hypothetical protein
VGGFFNDVVVGCGGGLGVGVVGFFSGDFAVDGCGGGERDGVDTGVGGKSRRWVGAVEGAFWRPIFRWAEWFGIAVVRPPSRTTRRTIFPCSALQNAPFFSD